MSVPISAVLAGTTPLDRIARCSSSTTVQKRSRFPSRWSSFSSGFGWSGYILGVAAVEALRRHGWVWSKWHNVQSTTCSSSRSLGVQGSRSSRTYRDKIYRKDKPAYSDEPNKLVRLVAKLYIGNHGRCWTSDQWNVGYITLKPWSPWIYHG